MWQANAPIESRFAPPQEDLDPVIQQKQQLYSQAMSDLGQQQKQAPKEGQRGSRNYGEKKDSNPMSSILSMIGGSNGNSSTMAGPDFGGFGNIA